MYYTEYTSQLSGVYRLGYSTKPEHQLATAQPF